MSRLVDPSICPDCRARLDPTSRCLGCGLALGGALGARLWQHMSAADDVIETIRRTQAASVSTGPVPATAIPASAVATRVAPAPLPPVPPTPAAATSPTGLPLRTVPALLLGLGGLFVLVAVSLFLAVTWVILPLVVKATLMVAVTVGIGSVATTLTRRRLRGSAEALWALTAALLVLDVSAAWRSDLLGLGTLSGRSAAAVTAALLMALGYGVATWVRRTSLPRLVAAEATLSVGIVALVASEVVQGAGSDGTRLVVGAALLSVVATLLRRTMREVAAVTLVLAALVWLDLVAAGVVVDGSLGRYWGDVAAWRLIAAAALVAVPALAARIPADVRTALAVATLGCLGLAAIQPLDLRTIQVLLVSAVIAAYAGIAVLGPARARAWTRAAALLGAVGAALALVATVFTPVVEVLGFLDAISHPLWTTPSNARFEDFPGATADAWTLAVLVVAGVLAAVSAARHLPAGIAQPVRTALVLAAPSLALLTLAGVLAGSRTPLSLVVATLVATAAAMPRRGAAPVRTPGVVLGVEATLLALALATTSDLLTALSATVLGLLALIEHLRRDERTAGAAAVVLAGWAAYGWARVAALDPTPRLLVPLLVSAVCLLLAGARRRPGSYVLEVAAAISLAVEVAAAATDPDGVRLALALTVAGTAFALASVIGDDREELGWLAGVVLFGATLVRLGTDTRLAPELYALPAAALLLAAGSHRMWRRPERGSWRLLGSGLNLALVPSLLLALPDPSSWRGLLVGLAAAVALAAGLRLRWQAPYLTGSAVLGVLALRFLLPLAAEVLANPFGAWILFGTAGGLLLAAGILWEQSLARLRTASRFVGALV